jgi:NHLM bacteriocin system ABC transporter peptidase/ATP-binding protein
MPGNAENNKILWKRKRVKVPTVLQMEMTECGAASLCMVMASHKLFLPLEKVRSDCGVSRDGSNAFNMVKAARSYGFDAKGFNYEPEKLHTLKLPLIIHWDFNHFVVLEGKKGNIFYLNDPASGPRKVSFEEFDKSFTGLALQIVPTDKFKPGGAPEHLFRAILSRLRNVKTAVFYIFLCSILLAVPGIIIPTMSSIFVDDVLGPNPDWLMPLILAMALTILVKVYITWLQRTAILKLSVNFIVSTTAGLFNHMMRLPAEFYFQRSAGELQYRILLNRNIADLISGQAGDIFASLFMVVFYLVVMFQYDVPLAATGVIIAALNVIVLKFVNDKRQTLNQSLIQEKSKMVSVMISGIQMMETIKASAADFDFFSKWAGHQAKTVNAEQRMSVSTIWMSALPQLLSTLNNTAILIFGAWRVMHGDMSMGMLVAFQALMGGFLSPVTMLTQLGARIQESKGSLDKVNDVLNYKRDEVFSRPEQTEGEKLFLEGDLELRNITYGYSPLGEPLLKDFSLHLKPGRRIALIGRSGSGKSTVAKIASGILRPWSGEILLDGKPVSSYSRRCIENSLAIVDQDIVMFSGTVRDNLTMWNPLKDDKDVIHAASDADIHYAIAGRAGGYGTEMTEGGSNFSGGERQRIEIARTLSNNPSILILDEATSALDPETEKIIDDNLRRRGCSCLIVAHRLSTVRDCEEIIVMDNGEIIQRGTHSELIKDEKGLYASLIRTE